MAFGAGLPSTPLGLVAALLLSLLDAISEAIAIALLGWLP